MTMTMTSDKDGRVETIPGEPPNVVDGSRWFAESVQVPAPAQALLEQYSGLAPEDVIPHVTDLVSGI